MRLESASGLSLSFFWLLAIADIMPYTHFLYWPWRLTTEALDLFRGALPLKFELDLVGGCGQQELHQAHSISPSGFWLNIIENARSLNEPFSRYHRSGPLLYQQCEADDSMAQRAKILFRSLRLDIMPALQICMTFEFVVVGHID